MNLLSPTLLKQFLLGLQDPVAWVVIVFVFASIALFGYLIKQASQRDPREEEARSVVSVAAHDFVKAFCCRPWHAAQYIGDSTICNNIPDDTNSNSNPSSKSDYYSESKPNSNTNTNLRGASLRKAVSKMRPTCNEKRFDESLLRRLTPRVEFSSEFTIATVTLSSSSPLRTVTFAAEDGADWDYENVSVVSFSLWSHDDDDEIAREVAEISSGMGEDGSSEEDGNGIGRGMDEDAYYTGPDGSRRASGNPRKRKGKRRK